MSLKIGNHMGRHSAQTEYDHHIGQASSSDATLSNEFEQFLREQNASDFELIHTGYGFRGRFDNMGRAIKNGTFKGTGGSQRLQFEIRIKNQEVFVPDSIKDIMVLHLV